MPLERFCPVLPNLPTILIASSHIKLCFGISFFRFDAQGFKFAGLVGGKLSVTCPMQIPI